MTFIHPLYQRDKRWGAKLFGNKYRPKDSTIARYGCLLTCYAMLAQYATGVNWFPPQIDYILNRKNGCGYDKGNRIVHSTLAHFFEEFAFEGLILCSHYPAPIPTIDTMFPVILKIDLEYGHWVLAKSRHGKDYLINDPLTGREELLLKRYGLPGWDLARIILTVVRMDVKKRNTFHAESAEEAQRTQRK